MRLSIDEVRYIARLARLRLTPEEEERLADEMADVLTYMEQLNAVDTTEVEPLSHVLDLVDVVREDDVEQRISHEEAMKNAPDTDGEYFRVPKVIS